ncbi:hypothetical protein C8R43DRAFT_868011, partial [Mycena crocata]
QTKLYEELDRLGATDPTWDQLMWNHPTSMLSSLKVLRLHPPVDDVIPIGEPITTKSGERVDSIVVAKGIIITVSICYMN